MSKKKDEHFQPMTVIALLDQSPSMPEAAKENCKFRRSKFGEKAA